DESRDGRRFGEVGSDGVGATGPEMTFISDDSCRLEATTVDDDPGSGGGQSDGGGAADTAGGTGDQGAARFEFAQSTNAWERMHGRPGERAACGQEQFSGRSMEQRMVDMRCDLHQRRKDKWPLVEPRMGNDRVRFVQNHVVQEKKVQVNESWG